MKIPMTTEAARQDSEISNTIDPQNIAEPLRDRTALQIIMDLTSRYNPTQHCEIMAKVLRHHQNARSVLDIEIYFDGVVYSDEYNSLENYVVDRNYAFTEVIVSKPETRNYTVY